MCRTRNAVNTINVFRGFKSHPLRNPVKNLMQGDAPSCTALHQIRGTLFRGTVVPEGLGAGDVSPKDYRTRASIPYKPETFRE